MRLVIVTHGYAPALNARAFRWTAIAEHWAAAGHEVHVVTVRSQGAPQSGRMNGVYVHRVGFYLDRIGLAARQSGHALATPGVSRRKSFAAAILRPLVRLAKSVHDLTWKKLYWPDYAVPWIPFAALKVSRLLRVEPRSAVISVSLPFSGHIAAWLGGADDARGGWIVDAGDPFSFMTDTPTNNHRVYSRLNVFADRKVLEAAGAMTVTSDGTRREYARRFGQANRISVIPPVLSVPNRRDFSGAAAAVRNNIVYIGTLNRRIRNPERLLALFASLLETKRAGDLHLHFYGETGDCSETLGGLGGEIAARVHVHGLVAREKALEAAGNALAVVNIGNATDFQLPSKLVEYAAAGRPIINLVKKSPDASEEFLSGVSGVLTLDELSPVPEQSGRLLQFLDAYRVQRPAPTPESWFTQFSLASVAASYEKILHQVRAGD